MYRCQLTYIPLGVPTYHARNRRLRFECKDMTLRTHKQYLDPNLQRNGQEEARIQINNNLPSVPRTLPSSHAPALSDSPWYRHIRHPPLRLLLMPTAAFPLLVG